MNDEENVKVELDSAKWALNISSKLLEEYKNCRTENAKMRVVARMKLWLQKMEYEDKILEQIIKKAKDEGIEF